MLSYKAFTPQQFVKKEELSSPQFKTPSPKLRATEVINLVSPALMTPKLEPAIDLVTPPPKRKRYPKLEPSPLQHGCSIEIISADSYSDEKPQQNFLVSPHVCEDRRFSSLDEAIQAVYEEEETLGHKWVKGQTKRGSGGEFRRITLRCNHYRLPTERHSIAIDPSNHRQGRSNKTDCKAHVNII